MAALLIKDSVNAASDAMGFTEALRHAFHVHELGHAHWAAHNENRYPLGLPPDVEDWRTPNRRRWPAVIRRSANSQQQTSNVNSGRKIGRNRAVISRSAFGAR